MFTGLVEAIGRVKRVDHLADSLTLTIGVPDGFSSFTHGESISVDGICLTVISSTGDSFTVDVMRETLNVTSLKNISVGKQVNLERALIAGGRLGGHYVQGHVDVVATLEQREPGDKWEYFTFNISKEFTRYIVKRGSIAIQGVSLTVTNVTKKHVTVSLIPETLRATTLSLLHPGDEVNIEVDILAKYAEKLLGKNR
ncbi:MAG: riboflavin synthase [Actinomycetota bacterium]